MKFCSLKNHSRLNTAINIMIHVTILWIFLTLFFSLIMVNIIQTTFDKEIEHAIKDNMKNALSDLTSDERLLLDTFKSSEVYATMLRYYALPDEGREQHNKWLIRTAWFIGGFLLISTLVSIFSAATLCADVPIGQFLLENIILFLGVAMIEGTFFYMIALKYIPIPPSLLVSAVIRNLQNI